ncbi:MAG: response regulator [Chloroflexi bacterium]|jgi:DNA-binding response OmpR family regulator|nr:response regulator [Chloroflexota bacterium]
MSVGDGGGVGAAAREPGGRPAVVLVVDDEPAIRRFVTRVVAQAAYETAEAGDGRSAIEIVRAEAARLAVVVCDLTLPDVSGADVVRAARALRPEVGVIVMTGWDPASAAEALGDVGPVELLAKPFTTAQVRAALDAVLGR